MQKKILSSFFVSVLLSTLVYGYSYSNNSLTIMGFDKNSSRIEVENTMKEAGIHYELYGFGEFDRVFNLYGGGCTTIHNVKWKGMSFDSMYFYYTPGGDKLVRIQMFLDSSISFAKIKEFFNSITKEYPVRRTITWHQTKNETLSILVKNGKNENESAVLTLYDPYSFNFFFRGGQLTAFNLIDEW